MRRLFVSLVFLRELNDLWWFASSMHALPTELEVI